MSFGKCNIKMRTVAATCMEPWKSYALYAAMGSEPGAVKFSFNRLTGKELIG